MNNPNAIDNLKPFAPGQSGNPSGYPKGQKNRSTIARKILEMTALYPKEVLAKLQEQFPEITNKTTAEEMMTIIQVNKAIQEGDDKSYKAVMDSAYGAPKQETDISFSEPKKLIIKINRNETD